jgi:hypothetical protein
MSATMPASGEIVRKAFAEWMSGAGCVSSIFSPHRTWEIVRLGMLLKWPGADGIWNQAEYRPQEEGTLRTSVPLLNSISVSEPVAASG